MNLSNEEVVKRLEKLTLSDYVNNNWKVLDDYSLVNKNSTTLQFIQVISKNCNVPFVSVVIISNEKIGSYTFGEDYTEYYTNEVRNLLLEEIKELIITPVEIILEDV